MTEPASALQPFAPDRGLTRALVGRASYTVDVNRSMAFEGAVRQSGAGGYGKAEYSQAHAQHWRTTVSGSLIFEASPGTSSVNTSANSTRNARASV